MTFNLHHALRRWEQRRKLILSQLVTLRPDILCLNEVWVPLDTGRWLWRAVGEAGIPYAYLQQNKTGALSGDEGQAILTRFPVVESGSLDYRSRDRIAQVVRLDLHGRAMDVYLTHLHHVRDEDGLREFMVQQLLAWIGQRDAPHAQLVCGDFNAPPDMGSVKLMRQRFAPTQTQPTFATPLRYHVDPDPDDTGEHQGTLSVCLDYIWYGPPLRLIESGLCFNSPAQDDSVLWPSDHIGVWADFNFGED